MELEIIEGIRRGSSVYVSRGFIYRLNRESKGIKYLKCQRRGCKGKGIFDGNTFNLRFQHGHVVEDIQIKKLRLKAHLKQKAAIVAGNNVPCSMRRIFDDACEVLKIDEPVIGYESVRSSLYRSRRSAMPPVPSDLKEYASVLKEYCKWSTTLDEPSFPFYQSFIQDKNKTIWSAVTFSSPKFIDLLSNSKQVILDRSYKAIPKELKACELLVIYGVFMDYLFPAIFIIISRGSEISYKGILCNVISNICPKSRTVAELIVSDYDSSILNAVSLVWPNATHIGSAFHFGQTVFQMHSKLNLASLTEYNIYAGRTLRMLMVWAFLPSDLLKLGLEEIRYFIRSKNLEEYFDEMLICMNNYWLNNIGSVETSLFNLDHMVSFETENFFHQLVDRMGPLPSVWHFTAKLRSLEHSLALEVEKLKNGELISRPRRGNILKLNATIRADSTKVRRGTCTVRAFLEKMARTVKLLESRLRRPKYPNVYSCYGDVSKLVNRLKHAGDKPEEFKTKVESLELKTDDKDRILKDERVKKEEKIFLLTPSDEDQDSKFSEPTCISCLVNKSVFSVTPCGHMNLCAGCTDSHREFGIFDQEGLRLEVCCPQCRSPVFTSQ